MKKPFLKITAFFLVLVFICSFISACHKTEPEKPDKFEYSYTDYYLLKDGVCDYIIVIPETSGDYLKMARDEFITLFKTATGITLPYIYDSGLEHSKEAKYISIGETSLFKTSGITIDKTALTEDGLRIITKDKSIYLIGGSDSGSLYAVYDFMALNFGYEQYFSDCMEIQKGVTEKKLGSFDITDIPDIALRAKNYGFFKGASSYEASMYGYRMRMNKERGEYMMNIFKDFSYTSSAARSTNCDYYLPYETYYKEHPAWFSDNCLNGENQFCYTAHGDETERQLMAQECAKKIEFSMSYFTPDKYPDLNVVTLTMQDNFRKCTCAACNASYEKYGTDSGALVQFINMVADLVDEWQNLPENKTYRRENLKIIFFAYNHFETPPVYFDGAKGVYKPVDQTVVPHKNVGVYLAIINNIEYQKPFSDSMNANGKMQLDGWASISDYLYYWNYETNFRNYMMYYDSFPYFTEETYRYVASKNVKMYFAQGQESSGEYGTTWNNLKAYLNAKLSWDSTLDTNTLTENWFDAMFKSAAPEMKKLYYSMRIYYSDLLEQNGLYQIRSNYLVLDKTSYWPLSTLESWVKMCDTAKEKVEYYKTADPSLYAAIIRHIEAEAFSNLYLIYTLYGDDISYAYKTEIYERLLNDITLLHLETKTIREHGQTVSENIKALY